MLYIVKHVYDTGGVSNVCSGWPFFQCWVISVENTYTCLLYHHRRLWETCFVSGFLYGCRHKYFELSLLVCISFCNPRKCRIKVIAILTVVWNLLKLVVTLATWLVECKKKKSHRSMDYFIFCQCYLLASRGSCVGLIARTEESYRVRCVWVWSQSPVRGGHDPESGGSATE
jgi:hypothetical protein